jgi:superfamily II DNA/RNA helicase
MRKKMTTFNELDLNINLKKKIEKLGFTIPTQIQAETIPEIIKGRDILGESATGSGKTLAFGCGIIEKVKPKEGLQALIITPTRELAEQVKVAICELTNELKVISIYGGVSISPQIKSLQTAEVIIATPGRLKDHMGRGTINTSKIKILVLDEADMMLDMGFIDDIKDIMKVIPKNKQTLLFSATVPQQIKHIVDSYLNNPIKVSAKKMVDPTKLTQLFYDVPKNLKFSLLVHLLKQDDSKLAMVFCNTRRSTDIIVKNLKNNKIEAIAIHGGFTQNKRDFALDNFKTGKSCVLVCTDVAARGLHIDNISHIYNYDLPNNPTDYVHRIGRTARAGEDGKAVNILCDLDHNNFRRILDQFREYEVIRTPLPELEKVFMHMPARRNTPDSYNRQSRPRTGFRKKKKTYHRN